MVSDSGGVGPVVEYLSKAPGVAKLHSIMTLGFISGFEHDLAANVAKYRGHIALIGALRDASEDHIKAAAAWALG